MPLCERWLIQTILKLTNRFTFTSGEIEIQCPPSADEVKDSSLLVVKDLGWIEKARLPISECEWYYIQLLFSSHKKKSGLRDGFAVPSGGGDSRPRTVSELKNKPQKKFQTIPYIGYIA
jgi:hypothetical protein